MPGSVLCPLYPRLPLGCPGNLHAALTSRTKQHIGVGSAHRGMEKGTRWRDEQEERSKKEEMAGENAGQNRKKGPKALCPRHLD